MPPDDGPSDLHLTRHGSGEHTWVGLHGWNGTHRTFDPLLPHLPPELGFVAVDLPGYGASAPPEKWSLATIGRRVADEIRRHDIERCSLIGSCSGAVVGLFVADELGEALDDFVLLEPFAYVPWYLSLFTTPVAGRLMYRVSFGTEMGRRIADAVMAEEEDDVAMMESFAETDLEIPLRYLQLFAELESPETFAELAGTKHLLFAERTFEDVRRSVELWRGVWNDVQALEVAGAGHLLLEEAADRVGDYLANLHASTRIPS